jgi:hypothetical protein
MPITILASRYNTLRNQVNLVLGTSNIASPSFGYGQAFSTNSVIGTRTVPNPVSADKVSAQDYEDLYIDLIRTRAHQIGAANVIIDEFVIGDYDANTATADKIEEAYVLGLEALAANIITDKFTVSPVNLDLTNSSTTSSSRIGGTAWNSQLSHIFTMTWPTAQDRRHFFNAGGEIRMSASVSYTGSQAKTVDWQSILAAMGSTSFNAKQTINNAGIGSGSNVNNYNLTSTYQLIYSRGGGAVYARNEYRIYAREVTTGDTTSAIQFKVDFVDGAPNDPTYGIDELVFGDFFSNVQIATPNSQVTINGTVHDAVVINTNPTGTLVRALS